MFSSLVFCSPALGFCFRSEDGSRVSWGRIGTPAGRGGAARDSRLPPPASRADSPGSRGFAFGPRTGGGFHGGESGVAAGLPTRPGVEGFPGRVGRREAFPTEPLPWAGGSWRCLTGLPGIVKEKIKNKKAGGRAGTKSGCSTGTSREVTHPSTIPAQRRLTSEF